MANEDWKTYRGQTPFNANGSSFEADDGPWSCNPRIVWGYLNNPEWTKSPTARAFAEGIGLPLSPDYNHTPCGHWHAGPGSDVVVGTGAGGGESIEYEEIPGGWYQATVTTNGTLLGTTTMSSNYNESTRTFIYNPATDTLYYWGEIDSYMSYGEPQVSRMNDEYVAYFGNSFDETDYEYLRLHIYPYNRETYYTNVWTFDYSDGDPYKGDGYAFRYAMGIAGDRIACAAHLSYEAGVPCEKWQIKTSYDRGLTFPYVFDINVDDTWSYGDYSDRMDILGDENGDLWACLRRARTVDTGVYLYKYNDSTTDWDLVYSKDYSTDLNSGKAYHFFFGLSQDGQNITMGVCQSVLGTYYHAVYYSTNGGSSFSSNLWTNSSLDFNYKTRTNGPTIISPSGAGFNRSTDYGTSWNLIVDEWGMDGSYSSFDCYGETWIYSECGNDFGTDSSQQGYLYSEDDGLTWTAKYLPLGAYEESLVEAEYGTIESYLGGGGGHIYYVSDEPQIWPM